MFRMILLSKNKRKSCKTVFSKKDNTEQQKLEKYLPLSVIRDYIN